MSNNPKDNRIMSNHSKDYIQDSNRYILNPCSISLEIRTINLNKLLQKYRFLHRYQKTWTVFLQRKGYNMNIVWTGRKNIEKMVIFLQGSLVNYNETNKRIKMLLVDPWLMKSVKKYNSICLKVDINFDLSSFNTSKLLALVCEL